VRLYVSIVAHILPRFQLMIDDTWIAFLPFLGAPVRFWL
jgi:hypothetical protein